jgi:thiol:disulfide interchange protein DsbA
MPFRPLSALFGLLLAFASFAQGAPVEGTDYIELKPPQAVETSGKVEVIEFFWYRCPHCYALEPDLEAWVKRLPRDVQFRRVPGILNEDWAVDARIFYALEAIGEVERVHRPLFNAIHQQGGVRLRGDVFAKWVADWLAKQKVDMAKYDAALHSFSVESRLRRAAQMASAYRLEGVPTLAVQGRYLVLASTSQKAMLATTDSLIGETRKQLPKTKQ